MTAHTCSVTDRHTCDDKHLEVLQTDRSLQYLFREVS